MAKLATHLNQQIQQQVKQWVNSVSQPAARQSSVGKLRLVAALKLVNQFVGQAIPFARRNRFKVIDFRPGYAGQSRYREWLLRSR